MDPEVPRFLSFSADFKNDRNFPKQTTLRMFGDQGRGGFCSGFLS